MKFFILKSYLTLNSHPALLCFIQKACGRKNLSQRTKRLAGGQDVKENTEPWYATLVRIGQTKGAKNCLNNKELNGKDSNQDNQVNSVNITVVRDETLYTNKPDNGLDIINHKNMNANNSDFSLNSNINFNLKDNNENRPFCGASLISDRYVITTASCLKDLNLDQFLVILNLYSLNPVDSMDMLKVRPSKIIIHPQYDEKANLNNIALIKLRRTIEFRFDLSIVPLCLVQESFNTDERDDEIDYYPGTLYTLGYGRLFNRSLGNSFTNSLTNSLMEMSGVKNQMRQFPNKLQIIYLRQDFFWCFLFFSNKFMQNRLCTVDNRLLHLTIRDVCEKDNGGPLIFLNLTMNAKTLVGISDAGYCTGLAPPTFTKVRSYLNWIDQMTIDSEFCRFPDLN